MRGPPKVSLLQKNVGSWQETECWQSVLVLFIISVHLGASDCKIVELVAKPNVNQVKFKYHPVTKSGF